MKASEDQIKTAQKLPERMEKTEDRTHVKERGYGVYEVGSGLVRKVTESDHLPSKHM